MSSLRACLVSPLPPPYGGIAHWTSMVLRYSASRSDADLVVINTAPTWRGIHNTSVLLRAIGGGGQLLADVVRLIRVLRRGDVDVVHLTTSGHLASVRDLAVSYVASFYRIPLVYHVRFGRIPAIAAANSLEWRVIRTVMRRVAAVVLIDRATFDAVAHFSPEVKSHLIPNCVDTAHLPVSRDTNGSVKVAMFLGWVVPTKGIGELVEAWSSLGLAGWRLEIVGPMDGAYREQLEQRFDLTAIDFVGPLSHEAAMAKMAGCDLFVLPSYTEGFPNAVVEAMALGRPIVATSVGAIPEMLEGGCGVLVNARDADDLRSAIGRVASSPELREQIGSKARERALSTYTIKVVFDAYVSLWGKVSKFVSE